MSGSSMLERQPTMSTKDAATPTRHSGDALTSRAAFARRGHLPITTRGDHEQPGSTPTDRARTLPRAIERDPGAAQRLPADAAG